MRTKLSPFVYKVKGKRNYLFFHSIKGQLFSITPEGDPIELEKQLLEKELVIKTKGVVPFEFKPNVSIYKSDFILKELQLRITGKCNLNCPECGDVGICIKDNTSISRNLVNKLAEQLISFNIETLAIIGGNPLMELETLKFIKSKINALNYKILCNSLLEDQFVKEKNILIKMGFCISHSICDIGNIKEENMSVDIRDFFYNKKFNPCWGNKLALDTNGDIKPCIWSDKVIGNISEKFLVNLVLERKCDEFWEITKDKIYVCQGCEFRYLCSDCRVMAEKKYGNLFSKTFDCSYCPNIGEWK